MDKCSLDITLEFLGVAFHNILYQAHLYPASVFEPRRKYGVVVQACIHPEVHKYIELCLKNISELLNTGKLDRIEFVLTNSTYESLVKFIFDIGKLQNSKDDDSYLVRCEQNLRAFCLRLSSVSRDLMKDIPENGSFTILLHTDESSAVALASNSDLEEFPFIESSYQTDNTFSIIPMRSFNFRGNHIETYIER